MVSTKVSNKASIMKVGTEILQAIQKNSRHLSFSTIMVLRIRCMFIGSYWDMNW